MFNDGSIANKSIKAINVNGYRINETKPLPNLKSAVIKRNK